MNPNLNPKTFRQNHGGKIIAALVILHFAFCTFNCPAAQTNLLYGYLGNYGLNIEAKKNVTLTLLWPRDRTDGLWFPRNDAVGSRTDTNGWFAFTNILWGIYRLDIEGLTGTKHPLYVGTNSLGSIPLASLVTNSAAVPPNDGTNYYTKSQVDALIDGIPAATGLVSNVGPALALVLGTIYLDPTWTNSLATTNQLATTSNALYSAISNPTDGGGITNLNDGIYFVTDYGIASTNADNSDSFQKLLTNVFNAGGGTIRFPAGNFKFLSRIRIPNDNAYPPKQPPIRITGAGGQHAGQSYAWSGGTILNLHSSNEFAKIDTRGLGHLTIDNLAMVTTNAGGTFTPFIKTLGTTLSINDCGFYGSAATLSANEDGIILGGTSPEDFIGFNTNNEACFQGYQTVIRNNWFNRIRRAVLFNNHANGNVVRDNNLWNECGGPEAIALRVTGVASIVGNVISGNLIEAIGYTNGIVCDGATYTTLTGNSFFDPPVSWIGNAYVFTNNAAGSIVLPGFTDNSLVRYTGSTASNQTFLTASPAEVSILPNRYLFTSAEPLIFTSGELWRLQMGAYLWRNFGVTDRISWELGYSGGTSALVGTNIYMVLQVSDTNTVTLTLGKGAGAAGRLSASELYLLCGGSSRSLWLGDINNQRHYLNNGIFYATTSGRNFGWRNGGMLGWSGTTSAADAAQAHFGFTNGAFRVYGTTPGAGGAYTNLEAGVVTAHAGVKTTALDATNSITTLGSITASNNLGNLAAVKLATNWFYSTTLGVTNLNFIGTLWTSATPGLYRITCAMVTTNFGAWGTNAFYIHPVTSFLGNTDSGDAAAWNGFTPAVVGECYSQSWTLLQDITNNITFQMVVGGDVASHNAAGTAYWAVEKIATY